MIFIPLSIARNHCKKNLAYPCDKKGTGNVVIKGLREEDNVGYNILCV
jgi:hypothetical protein